MSQDETKEALKEALKEWLDEKFSTFGRWSFGFLVSTLLGLTVWAVLVLNGWHRG